MAFILLNPIQPSFWLPVMETAQNYGCSVIVSNSNIPHEITEELQGEASMFVVSNFEEDLVEFCRKTGLKGVILSYFEEISVEFSVD